MGGTTKQGITGKIQGAWDPDRSVSAITAIGVPVEEALPYIEINVSRAVIHLECDCGE